MSSARTRNRPVRRARVMDTIDVSTPSGGGVDPVRVQRAIDAAGSAIDMLASNVLAVTFEAEVDLVTGTNYVSHTLGRRPRGCVVTPKTPSAAFACGYDWDQPNNPNPERQVLLEVVGGPMTVRVVFF